MSEQPGQTESHSELFGLPGQKRASTTAGAGAGSGVIGTSGHTGAANKAAETAGIENGGLSSAVPGSGAEQLTPSQGTGDVGEEKERKSSLVDKLKSLK